VLQQGEEVLDKSAGVVMSSDVEDEAVDSPAYQGLLEIEQDSWVFDDWCNPRNPPAHRCGEDDVSGGDDASDDGSSRSSSSSVREDGNDNINTNDTNEYVRRILRSADLHILQPGLVSAAYNAPDRELSLFHLYLTRDYLNRVCEWTNEALLAKGRTECSPKEFYGYIGLELGMSLLKFNSISSYWAKGCFLGHDTFREAMPRTRFQDVRSAVRFSTMKSYDHETALNDPLWFCRSMLEQFIRKSARIAVPMGVSALDENSCPTKARTKAKTYCPNKPAKYAIRFYAVVGHRYCYLHSMFDNSAGNTCGVPGVHRYTSLFRSLRGSYNRVIASDKSKDSVADSPTALWICMMGHQTSSCKQPPGTKRYFFCDNFYTRHNMVTLLHAFADKESYVIGTVKFTNVDATNRYYLSKGMQMLKDAARGTWCLVQACHKHPDYDKLRNQHTAQRRRSGSASPSFIPPLDNKASKCGYIVFKDSKVVVFYTNDLAEDPPEPILMGSDDRAVKCVHGLAKISRWTGTENLNRTDFFVAAPIVAYNMFMNGVDRMDQYRSTLATQRKERRLQMTIFTYLLDLAIGQAFALCQKMASQEGHSSPSYFSFKHKICDYLVDPLLSSRRVGPGRPRSITSPNDASSAAVSTTSSAINDDVIFGRNGGSQTIEQTMGVIDEAHMLVENLPRRVDPTQPQDIDCYLCRQMGKELKTSYSCVNCGKGFHVNCFTAYHYRGAMNASRTALLDVIFTATSKPYLGRRSKYAPQSASNLCLPAEKETERPRALIRTKANKAENERRKRARSGARNHQRDAHNIESESG